MKDKNSDSTKNKKMARYETLALLAKMEPNKRIIDCACGDGAAGAMSIISNFDPKLYYCVDIDKTDLRKCKKITENKAIYLCADIRTLELREKFDYYICSETLEHLECEDNEKTAKAISKLIKTGGKLLISVPGTLEDAFRHNGHKQMVYKETVMSMFNNFKLEAEDKYIKTRKRSKSFNSLYIFVKE